LAYDKRKSDKSLNISQRKRKRFEYDSWGHLYIVF